MYKTCVKFNLTKVSMLLELKGVVARIYNELTKRKERQSC